MWSGGVKKLQAASSSVTFNFFTPPDHIQCTVGNDTIPVIKGRPFLYPCFQDAGCSIFPLVLYGNSVGQKSKDVISQVFLVGFGTSKEVYLKIAVRHQRLTICAVTISGYIQTEFVKVSLFYFHGLQRKQRLIQRGQVKFTNISLHMKSGAI